MLFYFTSFYFILFHFISFYFILFHFNFFFLSPNISSQDTGPTPALRERKKETVLAGPATRVCHYLPS